MLWIITLLWTCRGLWWCWSTPPGGDTCTLINTRSSHVWNVSKSHHQPNSTARIGGTADSPKSYDRSIINYIQRWRNHSPMHTQSNILSWHLWKRHNNCSRHRNMYCVHNRSTKNIHCDLYIYYVNSLHENRIKHRWALKATRIRTARLYTIMVDHSQQKYYIIPESFVHWTKCCQI